MKTKVTLRFFLLLALAVALTGCGVVVVGDNTTVHQINQGNQGNQAAPEQTDDVWAQGLLALIYAALAVVVIGVFWALLGFGRFK